MSEGLKRRDFLKVLGATGAGAAAAGCTTGDVNRLIPYAIGDEEIVPSLPTWYASTCRECPAGCGIQVETHEGRATKVEGLPGHPVSHGNLCARGQSSVQGLYHPDRIPGAFRVDSAIGRQGVAWSTAERTLAGAIREAAGRVVFLTSDYTGTMNRLADDFVEAVGGRRVVYEPFGAQPRNLEFAEADVLVAFGADFLETWGSPVDYAWQFAQMRSRRGPDRPKFVWVGAHRGMTGLNADMWVAPRPGTEHLVARAMAGNGNLAAIAEETEVPQETLVRLAEEFGAGNGVALGPGSSMSGPGARELRQAVAALNGMAQPDELDAPDVQDMVRLVQAMNAGEVDVLLIDAIDPINTLPGGLGFDEALQRVPTRVSFSSFPDDTTERCNLLLPNHHFLEQWNDYEPREGVTSLVQPTMRPVFNTKQTGDVLLSVARQLGINPLSDIEATTYHDYIRANWAEEHGADQDGWREALRAGGLLTLEEAPEDDEDEDAEPEVPNGASPVPGQDVNGAQQGPTQAAPASPGTTPADPADGIDPAAALAAVPPAEQGRTPVVSDGRADFHLVVYPSLRFYDGRTGNRPWLLELPDPVTKVSWDSWVEIHPAAAEELGVRRGDLLHIESPYGTLEAPAFIYPGVRRDVVAIQMGLGQKSFGRYNNGRGVNPNHLLSPAVDEESGEFARAGLTVRVGATGRRHRIYEAGARVQHDREVAQAISVAALHEADERQEGTVPGYEIQTLRGRGGLGPTPTPTDPAGSFPTPGGHHGEYLAGDTRWAMVIDTDRCTGCSACVTACNAENNIPVVGPDQVRKGRELAWLRIERYFGVTRDETEGMTQESTNDTRFLPMLCQHCSNAPCEPVCPVYAAYHTPDGLNAQVYNRCVGTRYCANNCPYKVRVFNWFTYEFEQPLNWQLNPDVTVREKGVMEKCTFCVQRINEVNRAASREGRPIRDGEVTPACVQTCPSEVFVFGNISDPESEVARAAATNRSYRVFEEINVQPAIVYLKRITHEEPAESEWAHY